MFLLTLISGLGFGFGVFNFDIFSFDDIGFGVFSFGTSGFGVSGFLSLSSFIKSSLDLFS